MTKPEETSPEAGSMRAWLGTGMPWIWLTAGTVSFSLVMVFGLLALITLRGMGHFWPQDAVQLTLVNGDTSYALGEIVDPGDVCRDLVQPDARQRA